MCVSCVQPNELRELLHCPGTWIYEHQTIASLASKLALSGLVPTEEEAEEMLPPPELPPPRAPGLWVTVGQAIGLLAGGGFACWWLLALSLTTMALYAWCASVQALEPQACTSSWRASAGWRPAVSRSVAREKQTDPPYVEQALSLCSLDCHTSR